MRRADGRYTRCFPPRSLASLREYSGRLPPSVVQLYRARAFSLDYVWERVRVPRSAELDALHGYSVARPQQQQRWRRRREATAARNEHVALSPDNALVAFTGKHEIQVHEHSYVKGALRRHKSDWAFEQHDDDDDNDAVSDSLRVRLRAPFSTRWAWLLWNSLRPTQVVACNGAACVYDLERCAEDRPCVQCRASAPLRDLLFVEGSGHGAVMVTDRGHIFDLRAGLRRKKRALGDDGGGAARSASSAMEPCSYLNDASTDNMRAPSLSVMQLAPCAAPHLISLMGYQGTLRHMDMRCAESAARRPPDSYGYGGHAPAIFGLDEHHEHCAGDDGTRRRPRDAVVAVCRAPAALRGIGSARALPSAAHLPAHLSLAICSDDGAMNSVADIPLHDMRRMRLRWTYDEASADAACMPAHKYAPPPAYVRGTRGWRRQRRDEQGGAGGNGADTHFLCGEWSMSAADYFAQRPFGDGDAAVGATMHRAVPPAISVLPNDDAALMFAVGSDDHSIRVFDLRADGASRRRGGGGGGRLAASLCAPAWSADGELRRAGEASASGRDSDDDDRRCDRDDGDDGAGGEHDPSLSSSSSSAPLLARMPCDGEQGLVRAMAAEHRGRDLPALYTCAERGVSLHAPSSALLPRASFS